MRQLGLPVTGRLADSKEYLADRALLHVDWQAYEPMERHLFVGIQPVGNRPVLFDTLQEVVRPALGAPVGLQEDAACLGARIGEGFVGTARRQAITELFLDIQPSANREHLENALAGY